MSNSPWKEDKKLDAILKLDQTAKLCQEYGSTGCGVFKWGVQNQRDFCIRINIPRGHHFSNKVV